MNASVSVSLWPVPGPPHHFILRDVDLSIVYQDKEDDTAHNQRFHPFGRVRFIIQPMPVSAGEAVDVDAHGPLSWASPRLPPDVRVQDRQGYHIRIRNDGRIMVGRFDMDTEQREYLFVGLARIGPTIYHPQILQEQYVQRSLGNIGFKVWCAASGRENTSKPDFATAAFDTIERQQHLWSDIWDD